MNTSKHEFPPDLKDWCGHPFVSLRNWCCPDCDLPLNAQAQQRLISSPILAPPGHLWVFHERTLEDYADEPDAFDSIFLLTDRSKIAKRMVRDRVDSAKSIRARLKQIHWYQGVYNIRFFEGFDEDQTIRYPGKYHLSLSKIDSTV